jgi:hypothetical protein
VQPGSKRPPPAPQGSTWRLFPEPEVRPGELPNALPSLPLLSLLPSMKQTLDDSSRIACAHLAELVIILSYYAYRGPSDQVVHQDLNSIKICNGR